MLLSLGIATALVGYAAAATQRAGQVYTLPYREATSKTSVPRDLARLILLQRLAPTGDGPSIHEIPDGVDQKEAVSIINTFSRSVPALFSDDEELPRLLVMVEGLTEQQMKTASKSLSGKPSFSIIDPPSSGANEDLFQTDLHDAGITAQRKCTLTETLKETRGECWNENAAAIIINVEKNPEALERTLKDFKTIGKMSAKKELESTIVLLPATLGQSSDTYWSDKSQELRRRQAEQVISQQQKTASTVSATPAPTSSLPKGKIMACYKSESACIEATGNCSTHGLCLDKYARGGEKRADASAGAACFACSCLSSYGNNKTVTHWGGAACSKQDVSVPFWFFFGLTILLVGTVWAAISLLFSVGEEKLPGVIGAGVSRSK